MSKAHTTAIETQSRTSRCLSLVIYTSLALVGTILHERSGPPCRSCDLCLSSLLPCLLCGSCPCPWSRHRERGGWLVLDPRPLPRWRDRPRSSSSCVALPRSLARPGAEARPRSATSGGSVVPPPGDSAPSHVGTGMASADESAIRSQGPGVRAALSFEGSATNAE